MPDFDERNVAPTSGSLLGPGGAQVAGWDRKHTGLAVVGDPLNPAGQTHPPGVF